MVLPLYLAMTASEMGIFRPLPAKLAYMACHFSPYGTGLSNRPKNLPPGSMLILNDRTPICRHDPDLIADQLSDTIESLHCTRLLLDFQRQDNEETSMLAEKLIRSLPCPVGLSAGYAADFCNPVFLPPPPLDIPLAAYLAPWQGREIWLETALDSVQLILTPEGCRTVPIANASPGIFRDEVLHIHYDIGLSQDSATFSLCRTGDDLKDLLEEAESLGVTCAIGLWQELG